MDVVSKADRYDKRLDAQIRGLFYFLSPLRQGRMYGGLSRLKSMNHIV